MKRVRPCVGVTAEGRRCERRTAAPAGVCGQCAGAPAGPGPVAAAPPGPEPVDPLRMLLTVTDQAVWRLRYRHDAAVLAAEEQELADAIQSAPDLDAAALGGAVDEYEQFHAEWRDKAVSLLVELSEIPAGFGAPPDTIRVEAATLVAEEQRLSVALYDAEPGDADAAASFAYQEFWGEHRERVYELIGELAALPLELDSDAWAAAAAHSDPVTRTAAASHPDCPPAVLADLAGDSHPDVRAAVAANPAAPSAARAHAGLLN